MVHFVAGPCGAAGCARSGPKPDFLQGRGAWRASDQDTASAAPQRSSAPGPAVAAPPAQLPREGKESTAGEQEGADSRPADALFSSEAKDVSASGAVAATPADRSNAAAAATGHAAEPAGEADYDAIEATAAPSVAAGDPPPAPRPEPDAALAPAAQQPSATTFASAGAGLAAASQLDPLSSTVDVIMAEADGDEGPREQAAAVPENPTAASSPMEVDLPAQPDAGTTGVSAPGDSAPSGAPEAQAPSPARPNTAVIGEGVGQLAADADGGLDGTPGKRKVRSRPSCVLLRCHVSATPFSRQAQSEVAVDIDGRLSMVGRAVSADRPAAGQQDWHGILSRGAAGSASQAHSPTVQQQGLHHREGAHSMH